jgi:hypothetical protein
MKSCVTRILQGCQDHTAELLKQRSPVVVIRHQHTERQYLKEKVSTHLHIQHSNLGNP